MRDQHQMPLTRQKPGPTVRQFGSGECEAEGRVQGVVRTGERYLACRGLRAPAGRRLRRWREKEIEE